MAARPHPTAARLVASILAGALLVFAALPALHGSHGAAAGPAAPTFQAADASWTAADADCPLCRGLVRARMAPAMPGAEILREAGSLPVAERPQSLASREAARGERARAPPALS
jgi:hypothetical protein